MSYGANKQSERPHASTRQNAVGIPDAVERFARRTNFEISFGYVKFFKC